MPIKTFRGLLASDGVDKISLHTNNGSTGYKIVKFILFPNNPDNSHETTVKVYSTDTNPDVVTPTITADFNDNQLLAAGWFSFEGSGGGHATGFLNVVFDNMIFNQDIFVTSKCGQGRSMNYYLELEQIQLALDENTVATLKDIRNIKGQ